MKIVILGAPGAGKGTQAKRISKQYNIPHISTGDIFRSNIKNNTELGKMAKSYMDKGDLVPDELTVEMLLKRISEEDCKEGFILDGFPRTIVQADKLKEALSKNNEKIDYALDIELSDDDIIARMSGRRACPKCGRTYHLEYAAPKHEGICDACESELIIRSDDKPETVKDRLTVYHEKTEPLIKYYNEEGILKMVNGKASLDKVFADIIKVLG